jgi:hypothetical protein
MLGRIAELSVGHLPGFGTLRLISKQREFHMNVADQISLSHNLDTDVGIGPKRTFAAMQ